MKTVSPAFAALLGRNRGPFRLRLQIAWDGTNYVDETARCLSITYTQSLSAFTNDLLPTNSTDQCDIILSNYNWRYSPMHSGGDAAIRSYLSGPTGVYGKPFNIDYGLLIDGSYEYCRQFTGYLYSITPSATDQTVSINARDASQLILQKKLDTWTQRDLSYTQAMQYVYGMSGASADWQADSIPLRVPFVYLDDEDAISQCQSIARGVVAYFYHDSYGRPCFRTLHQQLANRVNYYALPRTFSYLDHPQDTDKLASDIIVGYSPRAIGVPSVVFETDTYYTILPHETRHFDLRLSQPIWAAYEVSELDYVVDNHSGHQMTSLVDVGVLVTGQKASVVLYNRSDSLPARLVYLRIRGIPLEGRPSEQVDKQIATTNLPPRERVRSIRDEFYIQTHAVANYVAENVAAIFGTVPYNYVLNSFQGLPQLELLDPVTFYDGRLITGERRGYIVQIATSWVNPQGLDTAADSFNQTLYVADVPTALTDNLFFIVGQSTIGSNYVTWH